MKLASRNMEFDGVLINVYFFCKAMGLKQPRAPVIEPVYYISAQVEQNGWEWKTVAEKVKVVREHHRDARRTVQTQKKAVERQQDKEFIAQYQAPTKTRSCLRCDTSFSSVAGNRLCVNCKTVVNRFLGADGT